MLFLMENLSFFRIECGGMAMKKEVEQHSDCVWGKLGVGMELILSESESDVFFFPCRFFSSLISLNFKI